MLHDPVTADLNNGKTFSMLVSGQGGLVHLGGHTDLDAAGGSTVTFAGGPRDVVLRSDYRLSNSGEGHYNNGGALAVVFESGNHLTMDLSTRETGDSLPLIARGSAANAGEVSVVGVASLGAVYNSFTPWDELDERWLLVDPATVKATLDNFTVHSTDLFTLSILQDETTNRIYLAINNSSVLANTRDSVYSNVRAAFSSGALESAWQAYAADAGNANPVNDSFAALATNPQHFLAEAAVTAPVFVFNFNNQLADTALERQAQSRREWEDAVAAAGEGYMSLCLTRTPYRWRFWGGYLGGDTDIDSGRGYAGYDSRYNAYHLGGSYDFSDVVAAGAYFSHGSATHHADELNSRVKTDANAGGVFASIRPLRNFTVDLDAGYGHFDNDMRRRNLVDGTVTSDFNQNSWMAGAQASYRIEFSPRSIIEPYLGFRWQRVRQNGFREAGGRGFANAVDRISANSFASRLGVRYGHRFPLGNGGYLTPSAHAAWRHEFADRQFTANGRFASVPEPIPLKSAKLRRDYAELGVRVKADLVRREAYTVSLEAGYDVNLSGDYVGQLWHAGVAVGF